VSEVPPDIALAVTDCNRGVAHLSV
jgi:hypothetical protein